MVTTATHTDKSSLSFFSETPLVWLVPKKSEEINPENPDDIFECRFFGDEDKIPSCECIPHWILHKGSAAKRVIHCHPVDVIKYIRRFHRRNNIHTEDGQIMTIGYERQGTVRLGELLTAGVTSPTTLSGMAIEEHGLWIADDDFDDALALAEKIADFCRQQLDAS